LKNHRQSSLRYSSSGGGFFVARPVGERLDHRNRAAVGELAGEHELEARLHALAQERDGAEHVLHRVAEAEAVALAVVDERGGARPRVGDERVVGVPHVDHVVELRVGRLDLQRSSGACQAALSFCEFRGAALRIAEFGDGLSGRANRRCRGRGAR
jgi:hypothetical protein